MRSILLPDAISTDEYRAMLAGEKPRKYRNEPVMVDGIRFDSKAEARRFGELRMLEMAGEITALECQTRFPLVVNGVKVCVYVADFTYVETMTGEKVTEDVKGVRNSTYKLKRALMKAVYGITIKETSA